MGRWVGIAISKRIGHVTMVNTTPTIQTQRIHRYVGKDNYDIRVQRT